MVVPNWHHHEIYVTAPNHQNSATRKAYVDYHINNQINGERDFHNNKITSLKAGTNDAADSINKKQFNDGLALKANTSELSNYIKKDGSVALILDWNIGNNVKIFASTAPSQHSHLAKYFDDQTP